MSWGYFADLELTLPRAAWKDLADERVVELTLPPGWSGFEERELEAAFGRPSTGDESFAQVLRWASYDKEAVRRIVVDDATASIRVALLLDKSLLDLAFPLAALLFAARDRGGRGTLTLVNDGTYAGEDGTVITLADGVIAAAPVEDMWSVVERLGGEIFGTLDEDEDEGDVAPVAKAKPPAKKAAAKKVPAKKAAAKKAAAKPKAKAKKVAAKPKAKAKKAAAKPKAKAKKVAAKPKAKKPAARPRR